MKATEERQIHVRLSVELYKALRIRCVNEDKSIQEFVAGLLMKALQAQLENEGAARIGRREGRKP